MIECFLCNSYPCVLFESLAHVINQESHVYSWNLGKILKKWTRQIDPKFSSLNMWLQVLMLQIFFEILSYWKEKSFDTTTSTIPI